jgi:ATP-dependent DNA helicase DinG
LHALLDALAASLPRLLPRRGRTGYHDGDEVFGAVRQELRTAIESLDATARAAFELQMECDGLVDDPPAEDCSAALELGAILAREIGAGLDFLAAGNNEDWAFALDFGPAGGALALREILASPLDVAADVQRLVVAAGGGAVYTSATLAVGGGFEYFLQRVGLSAATPCLAVPSPFDYASQCLVAQATFLPAYNDAAFEPQVAAILAAIAARTGRRTLVLLTSHASLRLLHAELLQRLGATFPLLAQDVSGSRASLASRFAITPGAMLLGTSSFWEGVDFPGQALEVLALVKLPFLVPEEPLVAARSARLRRAGENPFTSYFLPEAVLRFAQGFGRLVRSRHDRGVVLLLDSRLSDRHYRKKFLSALPVQPQAFEDPPSLVERTVSWLETHAAR